MLTSVSCSVVCETKETLSQLHKPSTLLEHERYSFAAWERVGGENYWSFGSNRNSVNKAEKLAQAGERVVARTSNNKRNWSLISKKQRRKRERNEKLCWCVRLSLHNLFCSFLSTLSNSFFLVSLHVPTSTSTHLSSRLSVYQRNCFYVDFMFYVNRWSCFAPPTLFADIFFWRSDGLLAPETKKRKIFHIFPHYSSTSSRLGRVKREFLVGSTTHKEWKVDFYAF